MEVLESIHDLGYSVGMATCFPLPIECNLHRSRCRCKFDRNKVHDTFPKTDCTVHRKPRKVRNLEASRVVGSSLTDFLKWHFLSVIVLTGLVRLKGEFIEVSILSWKEYQHKATLTIRIWFVLSDRFTSFFSMSLCRTEYLHGFRTNQQC
jgi:hypothetical protein